MNKAIRSVEVEVTPRVATLTAVAKLMDTWNGFAQKHGLKLRATLQAPVSSLVVGVESEKAQDLMGRFYELIEGLGQIYRLDVTVHGTFDNRKSRDHCETIEQLKEKIGKLVTKVTNDVIDDFRDALRSRRPY